MLALPFKLNQDRRHHIPRQQHKVTNWPAYEASLRQRGSLTVWFTDEAIAAWAAEPRTSRGGQPWYSALAIPDGVDLARRVPPRIPADRRPDRFRYRPARSHIACAGPHDAEPPGGDIGGAEVGGGQHRRWRQRRTFAPAGGQHGAQAVWCGRVADREARDQNAPVLEEVAPRRGRMHRADRGLRADQPRRG